MSEMMSGVGEMSRWLSDGSGNGDLEKASWHIVLLGKRILVTSIRCGK